MKKKELIQTLAGKTGLPETQIKSIVNHMLQTLSEELENEKQIRISGFGCFSPWSQKERLARNPKTGVPVMIRPRMSVKFKPGSDLLKILNKK